MASFQLCNPKTSQISSDFSAMIASSSQINTVAATPFKVKSAKLRLNSLLSQTHPHNVISDREPSTSSSSTSCKQEFPLTIGIIGLGAFGQFLAKAFQRQGHTILATSRSDYSQYCQHHGIDFFPLLDGLCDAQPDVLLVCSSIVSTEAVVRGIPFHKLKPDTIIADVLSVKQFPKNLLLEVVPSGFGILCTHPMFGKFSGKHTWEGLRFVFDKVRINAENSLQGRKCEQFLNIFQDEGCRMVEMTCEEHDRYAAESQFVTHTIARILSNMNLESTPIDTKGYETLMELTRNSTAHGSDLYDGLFLYNVNSAKQIQNLEEAFDTVKKSLFAKLRKSMKAQLEETVPLEQQPTVQSQSYQFLPRSEKVLQDVSSFSLIPGKGNMQSSPGLKSDVYHRTI